MKGLQNIISIAEFLHSNYEFFAHKTGWQTQKKCQVDFWELPPSNIKTMLYLAQHLEGVFNIDFETLTISQPIGEIPQMKGTQEALDNLTLNN